MRTFLLLIKLSALMAALAVMSVFDEDKALAIFERMVKA